MRAIRVFAHIFLLSVISLTALSCDAGEGRPGETRTTKWGGLFTKKVTETKGRYYYRVQASYSLKSTGEPIEFDFVVSCGAEVTHWRYTGPSTRVSTHPLVMVKATSDGGAIMMRTWREVCSHGTEWGYMDQYDQYGVPDDLLPFIIAFDDVNDLSFGWGYATEDAYYAGNSRFDFHGASIADSNYEEWRAWRKRAEAEYRQIGQLPGPWGYSYTNGPRAHTKFVKSLSATGEDITNFCQGYVRIPTPPDIIERIWAEAPPDNPPPDQGRYFTINANHLWLSDIVRDVGPVFEGHEFNAYMNNPNSSTFGAINRNNSGILRWPGNEHKVIGEHYPILPRSKSTDTPITAPADVYPQRILISDAWKGMIACGGDYYVPGPDDLYEAEVLPHRPEGEKVVILRDQSFDPDWKQKQFPLYVNDEVIVENLMDRMPGGLSERYFIIDRQGFILNSQVWGRGSI